MLVEGARDVAALRELGMEGTIIKLNRGQSLVERADQLSRLHERVLLLTDWDRKGMQLHERLKGLLEGSRVVVLDHLWLRLRKLCGSGCRTVEELPALVSMLREK